MKSLLAKIAEPLPQRVKVLVGVLLAALLLVGSPATLSEAIGAAPAESTESQQDGSGKECVSSRGLAALVTRSSRNRVGESTHSVGKPTFEDHQRRGWLADFSLGKILGGVHHALRNGLGTALRI